MLVRGLGRFGFWVSLGHPDLWPRMELKPLRAKYGDPFPFGFAQGQDDKILWQVDGWGL